MDYEYWYCPRTNALRSYAFDGDVAKMASEPIPIENAHMKPHDKLHRFDWCLSVTREWLRSSGSMPYEEWTRADEKARKAENRSQRKAMKEAQASLFEDATAGLEAQA